METTGVNNDRYRVWRQGEQSEIGYVHLAFKTILQALQDYFHGTPTEMMSAALFFYGNPQQSTFKLWCHVLGQTETDMIIDCLNNYHKTGRSPDDETFRELDRLYNNMTQ